MTNTYIWLYEYDAVIATAETVEQARKIAKEKLKGREVWDTRKFDDISISKAVKRAPVVILNGDATILYHANE